MAAIRRMPIFVALSIALTTILSLISIAESDCPLGSLRPCYAFIGSSLATPPPDCCRGVGNILQTQPLCLCDVLNIDGINRTRVLAIPKGCNLQSPPVSSCQAARNATQTPSVYAGYSTKISYSPLLSVLSALFCAGTFIVI
ncbi:hypothetical protein CDL12_12901 [Handroanthus impetiginosus]|uniref:Bifunctional inhibitor/plant lipid transfer protein/seed storage helical domain-containing protein n=1 Tax=Handroanthus impetiginosus TaxID=429701 RepID=A0A2G9HAB1_9LAMI|nr:hypothetical protein CDL12_12901 [Handroanthus impetiginosus]